METDRIDGSGGGAAPATQWLSPLDSDVPADWVTEEQGFIFLWACNTACASFEGAQTPEAQLSDGCWQLFTITAGESCRILRVRVQLNGHL